MTKSKVTTKRTNNHAFDDKAIGFAVAWAKAESKEGKAGIDFVVYARKECFMLSTDLLAPSNADSTATQVSWDRLRAQADLTRSQAVQNLLAMGKEAAGSKKAKDHTTASPSGDWAYWNRQWGSRITSWRKRLETAEKAEFKQAYADSVKQAKEDGTKAPAKPAALKTSADKPLSVYVETKINEAIGYIEKRDGKPMFNYASKAQAHKVLEQALASLKLLKPQVKPRHKIAAPKS